MPKIQKLPQHETEKIAAGEIVQRPVNIVKELMENAIDAGATHITIYVQNGGKTSIRIVDNGSGMDCQDAQHCFEHHATSKIRSVSDLHTIHTFGFRGEALSAIASVSRVTLITKMADQLAGTKVVVEGGVQTAIQEVHAAVGTDILVEDVFYNLPARKKFLKSDETEWRHIIKLFHASVFSYPSLHITLYNQNIAYYNCPPVEEAIERFTQLFDHHAYSKMIPSRSESSSLHNTVIKGFISRQDYWRYDRSNIFLFINGRWIRNNIYIRAVVQGYDGVLAPGSFPYACIDIQVPAEDLDINVHPRKEEVEYRYEAQLARSIKSMVQQLLRDVVQKHLQQSTPPSSRMSALNTQERTISRYDNRAPVHDLYHQTFVETHHHEKQNAYPVIEPVHNIDAKEPLLLSTVDALPPDLSSSQAVMQHAIIQDQEPPAIVTQYMQTYILLEHAQGLLFIDQHAAHERIIFENLQNDREIITVPLIFPAQLTFSTADFLLLQSHINTLGQYGFVCEPSGHQQIWVRAIPVYAKEISVQEILQQFVAFLYTYHDHAADELQAYLAQKLYAFIACKTAVRAGDILTREKMIELVQTLKRCAAAQTCPHGRPTSWLLPIQEITKKFKRDYKSGKTVI